MKHPKDGIGAAWNTTGEKVLGLGGAEAKSGKARVQNQKPG
jgi:hypothetical protein